MYLVLKGERKREQWCLLSSPHLLSTGADEMYNCPVMISSHGDSFIPAVISHDLSHTGYPVAPTCVPLSQPSVRSLQTVSPLPQLTPIPWRVHEGISGPLKLWPMQPYPNPFQFISACLQGCCLTESHLGSQPWVLFCLEPKHKGVSTLSHLIPTSLLWTWRERVQGPHISIWGLFSLVTLPSPNVPKALTMFCYYTYTVIIHMQEQRIFFSGSLLPKWERLVYMKWGAFTCLVIISCIIMQGTRW